MCFTYSIHTTRKDLVDRYDAIIAEDLSNEFFDNKVEAYNGFTFPFLPVITNSKPDVIEFFQWGLLPAWAKDRDFRKNTLNARLESIHEKPSFKNSLQMRCLVPANSFTEWHWNDPKGKSKDKYLLNFDDVPIFSFAGLYSFWTDKSTGEIVPSFTIITTEANELMSFVHNNKKRMPVILDSKHEREWLQKGDIKMMNDSLKAWRY